MVPEHFMDLIASKGIAWASVQDAAGALIAIIANPLVNGTVSSNLIVHTSGLRINSILTTIDIS